MRVRAAFISRCTSRAGALRRLRCRTSTLSCCVSGEFGGARTVLAFTQHSCYERDRVVERLGRWESVEAALPRSTLSLLERLSEAPQVRVPRGGARARLSVKDRLFLLCTSHELEHTVLTSGLPIVGDGRRRVTMYRDGVHSIACGPLRVFQYCIAQGCPWLSPHTPSCTSLARGIPCYRMRTRWDAPGTGEPASEPRAAPRHRTSRASSTRTRTAARGTSASSPMPPPPRPSKRSATSSTRAAPTTSPSRSARPRTGGSTSSRRSRPPQSPAASRSPPRRRPHGHLPCLKYAVETLRCRRGRAGAEPSHGVGPQGRSVRYLVAARCPGWDAYDEAWSPGSPQW